MKKSRLLLFRSFNRKKSLVSYFFMLIMVAGSFSDVLAGPGKEYQWYKDRIDSLQKKGMVDSAFAVTQEAIMQSGLGGDSVSLAYFYYRKATFLGPYQREEALSYYFKARKILEPLGDSENLGILYRELARYQPQDEAAASLKKALEIFTKLEVTHKTFKLAHIYNTIAGFYLCHEDSAKFYINKSLAVSEGSSELEVQQQRAASYVNLGLIHRENGNLDSAMFYFKKAKEFIAGYSEEDQVIIQWNFMDLFFRQGENDSALMYYDRIRQDLLAHPNLAINSFGWLVDYYRAGQNYSMAFYYDAKLDSTKEYMYSHTNQHAYSLMEMENAAKLKQAEISRLNLQMAKDRQRSLFITLLLVVSLVFSVIVIYQIRQKNSKKREALLQRQRKVEMEQKLLAAELENSELKSKQLSDELKYTNNELASFAARMVQNREILTEVKKRIEGAMRRSESEIIKDTLRELQIMLMQLIDKDSENRQKLINKAEDINASFMYSLKTRFPDLSESDLDLLVLLLLKFNSKEIASIYNIEERSVVKKRYRLRQRLNVDKYASLDDFLKSVIEEIGWLEAV